MRAASRGGELPFYLRYAGFQLRERFTDLLSAFAYLALYPFFIWLLTQMWGRFNAYQGHYSRSEIFVYIAITELLFMTFLRSPFMQRTAADFSISLSRPRSWLTMTFAGQFGATLGARLVYAVTALLLLPFFGVPAKDVIDAFFRLLLLIPLLGVVEALMASVLASAQLLWHETRYLVLPITKIFLALGGVFGPLADYGEPGRSIFLKLPASDFFFQVGHFCIKGEFYEMSELEWVVRILFWIVVFAIWNRIFFRFAKSRHQSFGG